ncbi:hypothetical protein STXM2123_5738 [Streptomyces sp. F-3]|nr:hypothetical protein STXM2123_5738 [Streptomyces sp. F-3]
MAHAGRGPRAPVPVDLHRARRLPCPVEFVVNLAMPLWNLFDAPSGSFPGFLRERSPHSLPP